VGREIGDLERITSRFRDALVWGGGIALLLALLVGVLMSTSVLRRVESINSTTRQIMSGDLSRRVESRGSGDEFDQLADNLNRMLEEIERLMEGIRHVADNIAHDLRTPLTRLRNALEEAERESDPETARQLVQTAIAGADQLLETFRALLRIARLEAGGYEVEHKPIRLNELVDDALDLYQAVAEEKNIELVSRSQGLATVDGDRDLLFQLLANLIDNAVKYTPEGGRVVVGLEVEGDSVALSVADSGPGIPEAMRSRVLERFFRMDSARNEPGNGLGLSLVSVVARQHRADLALTDNAPGLKVTLRVPAVAPEAPS
jgi:signal transduction histidine kinase